jgi:hypothetical protein
MFLHFKHRTDKILKVMFWHPCHWNWERVRHPVTPTSWGHLPYHSFPTMLTHSSLTSPATLQQISSSHGNPHSFTPFLRKRICLYGFYANHMAFSSTELNSTMACWTLLCAFYCSERF